MPDQPEYVVPPNTETAKLQAGLATTGRDLTIVIAFGTAILGFVGKRDLSGAINYLQSAEALPAMALLIGVGTSAYRFWMARHSVKVTALAASSPKNSVVQVKGS